MVSNSAINCIVVLRGVGYISDGENKMIPIKIRVWDKTAKRMIYLCGPHDSLWFSRSGVARYLNMQNGSGGNEYELMRYSGREDINDADIYEGDIADIRYQGGGHELFDFTPCVCKFGEYDAFCEGCTAGQELLMAFYFKQIGGPNIFSLNGNNDEGAEIIGNIYQDPKLMVHK